MFDRILLLTDLSDVTRLTFKPLARIATAFDSKVTIFHAFRGSSELFYLEGEAARLLSLIDDADADRARPTLDAYVQELAALGVEADVRIRAGSFFDLAVQVMHETQADLVVIPTQGHHEFTGRVLGSTVARILRDTDVPVLTVNERFGERAAEWSNFGHVLYPADLSARDGQPVLHAAEDMTAEFGGRVEVVHVVEPIHTQTLQTPEGEILLPKDLQYQIKSRFQAQLSEIAHTVTRVPSCWQLIEDHKPGSGLMTYADRHAVDLIVLPALSRDQTRNTVLGSVAEHVIKHARCPVLTLRGPFAVQAADAAAAPGASQGEPA